MEDVPARYLIVGKEVGAGGTPHLQGYVEFQNPKTISAVKRIPGFARAHIEKRRGSPREAADYCRKDGDVYEKGEISRQGSRSDLQAIREEIEQGATERQIAETHFEQWVVYRRSFERYRSLLAVRRTWKSRVIVLVGPTGVGKTRFVYHQHPDDEIFVWAGDRWFDGYHGQPIVLFDDFRGELELANMLRLCDRYPMDVPVKGGFANWVPRRIYITSNVLPQMWYPNSGREALEPLWRRIDTMHNVYENIFDN